MANARSWENFGSHSVVAPRGSSYTHKHTHIYTRTRETERISSPTLDVAGRQRWRRRRQRRITSPDPSNCLDVGRPYTTQCTTFINTGCCIRFHLSRFHSIIRRTITRSRARAPVFPTPFINSRLRTPTPPSLDFSYLSRSLLLFFFDQGTSGNFYSIDTPPPFIRLSEHPGFANLVQSSDFFASWAFAFLRRK